MNKKTKTSTERIRNANVLHRLALSPLDRLAIWVTHHVGTMGFFLIILLWTVSWLGWNVWGPEERRFDPYPAFVLWLFISNMIQLVLLPLIMVGQSLQNRHAELRAESEYKINLRINREISYIRRQLETLRRRLK